ncbi:MAG: DEAD/DEAH box helicase [Candidatus Ornithospirochaeta sp.]|nr:DEAD/DEAH box helicase [Candidatus Ornithospirochaeta sp.]
MDLLPSFAELGLSEESLLALKEKGFEEPTDIQKACIPLLLEKGTEVVGQAQTGTGKTAAFALPILETIDCGSNATQALILAPTRELAMQVAEEINSLKGKRKIDIAPIYGGASMEVQLKKLRKGLQIVVGTPGRILDHIRRGSLKLDRLEFMVLDEADEMLDMGFIEDIEEVLKATPDDKRMLMFSATMPPEIQRLAETFMKNAQIIRTQKKDTSAVNTDQIYYEVREADKIEALTRIIDREASFYGVVFCRTKLQCDEIGSKLRSRGYDAEALHGDLSQREREKILKDMKEHTISILVATDVAARGLDIQDLTHVINYSLPEDPEIYIHRVGRTGRAGKTGTAITFITPSESRRFSYIKRASRSEIRREEIPEAEEIIRGKKERISEEIREAIKNDVLDDYRDLASRILEDEDAEDAFAALLQYIYKDELDASQYRKIEAVSSSRTRDRAKKERERKEGMRNHEKYDRVKAPSLDEEGFTRLFIARGRNDGLTKRGLANILIDQAGVRDEDLQGIQVMEDFSFVNAPFSVAEEILKTFSARKGEKPIITKARPESGQRKEMPARAKRRKDWEEDSQPYGRDSWYDDDEGLSFPDRKKRKGSTTRPRKKEIKKKADSKRGRRK